MSGPPAQDEWHWAIRRDPLAVVFSGNVDVPASGMTSLTGRMADQIPRFHPGTHGNAVFVGNVQI